MSDRHSYVNQSRGWQQCRREEKPGCGARAAALLLLVVAPWLAAALALARLLA